MVVFLTVGLVIRMALSYTDFWEVYAAVFPTTRHLVVGKETGKTNHIERVNNPLRQRVSRLVGRLCLSRKSWETILEIFGILFIIVTPLARLISPKLSKHHYPFNPGTTPLVFVSDSLSTRVISHHGFHV